MVTAKDVANLHHEHGHSCVQLRIIDWQLWARACGGFGWLVVLRGSIRRGARAVRKMGLFRRPFPVV